MRIDLQDLRRHYASLPDEALIALDRAELTDAAKLLYDEELARRELMSGPEADSLDEPDDGDTPLDQPGEIGEAEGELDIDAGPPPDWLEDATCACAFTIQSATSYVPAAAKAHAVLRAARIPCRVTMIQEEPPRADPAPQYSLRLMVPGALALHAMSVLDQDIFNEEQESGWRTHLEALSDNELRALDPEILCAGLLDRVARLRGAYDDEIARRKLKPRRS